MPSATEGKNPHRHSRPAEPLLPARRTLILIAATGYGLFGAVMTAAVGALSAARRAPERNRRAERTLPAHQPRVTPNRSLIPAGQRAIAPLRHYSCGQTTAWNQHQCPN